LHTVASASNSSFRFRAAVASLPFELLLVHFFIPERIQKLVEPAPWGPKQGDGGGPHSPDVSRPDTKDLLKKCAAWILINPSGIASAPVNNITLPVAFDRNVSGRTSDFPVLCDIKELLASAAVNQWPRRGTTEHSIISYDSFAPL
jgi:hypothetical protein